MARIQPGLTLPEELWQEAKKTYGKRKTSNKIEELLRKDLELKQEKPIKIFDLTKLQNKRRELAETLIAKNNFPYDRVQISKIARDNGIYTSKKWLKKAVKAIDRSDFSLEMKDGKLQTSELDCVDCEANFTLQALKKSDNMCPECGQEYKLT